VRRERRERGGEQTPSLTTFLLIGMPSPLKKEEEKTTWEEKKEKGGKPRATARSFNYLLL